MPSPEFPSQPAVYDGDQVRLDGGVDWPAGTRLLVTPVHPPRSISGTEGHVIVAGFGLAGRAVASLCDAASVPYIIVEQNRATVQTQKSLGRRIVEGDVTHPETLQQAGLSAAAILALTIPDENAVLRAISLARRLHPDIYIIARTTYSSKGMQASQLGANEVIKAEQAVAVQFHERLRRRITSALNGHHCETQITPHGEPT